MANIYLLINLSLSNIWLGRALGASQGQLAANGIDLAPFAGENADFPPCYSAFWYVSATEPLQPALAEKLAAVQASLAKGRDVLLLGQSADPDIQKEFFAFIRKYLHTEKHTVIPLIIMGKPSLSMEFWWQITPNGVDDALAEKYMEYAGQFLRLALEAREEWGKERVTLIPDPCDTLTADGVYGMLARVFKALGIKAAPRSATPLPFFGFTNTATAARLLKAKQVRHNDWPRLDDAAYMSALRKLDPGWGPEPLSPLSRRRALLEKGRADLEKLENLLGLPAHSLDAPAWYGTLPEMDGSTPLKPERLQAFAASLPRPVREVLLKRFDNDHALLSQDQKALALALAQTEGARFESMGEPREQPLLTVLTMTRNHEKYIGQCLEGVLAQKTDFAVRHLVLDHYSTDGTPRIIEQYAREYPSIRPVLLHNYSWFYNNVRDLFIRCGSEYAALCDGDDYFTEPLKLQKQVDFLEKHPRCALCFHPVAVVFEDGQAGIFPPPDMLPRGMREECHLAVLCKGNIIQTNSVVYRWRFREGLPEWFRHDLCPGDWYWHLLHAEQGRIGFLPEVMSVYRRHGKSLYKDSFSNRVEHRRKFGMAELETYHVANEHFKDRYFLPLANLAKDVFCDFLDIFMQEGDASLLDLACETYPKFGKHFLNEIKLKARPRAAQESPK